jgi:hypothetical protein
VLATCSLIACRGAGPAASTTVDSPYAACELRGITLHGRA